MKRDAGFFERLKLGLGYAFAAKSFAKIGRLRIDEWQQTEGVGPNKDSENFQSLYSEHPWIYAGVYAIASAGAGVPLRAYKRTKDKLTDVVDHPFLALLENPNEFMTDVDLMELLFIYLELDGNSYWLFDDGKEDGKSPDELKLQDVKEIWPVMPQDMKPLPDKKKFLRGFRYAPPGAGKGIVFTPAQVLQLKYSNPQSLHLGVGSVSAAKRAIVAELHADAWNANFFKNGALPPGYLQTEQVLTDEVFYRLKSEWAKQHQGVKNAHKMALLDGGVKMSVNGPSHKDMEFNETSRQAMVKTLSALGVPPIMVGVLDEATYNNAAEQKRTFWDNTMLPKMRKIQRMLTKRLQSMTGEKDLVVMFDLSGVEALRPAFKEMAETAKTLTGIGIPLNEVIQKLRMPFDPVEGGDVPLVDFGKVPLSEAAAGTPEAPEPKDEPDAADDEKILRNADAVRAADPGYIPWRKFVIRTDPGIAALRNECRAMFRIQEAAVLAALERSKSMKADIDVDVFLFDIADENRRWQKRVTPHLKRVFERMGKQVVADIGVGVSFELNNPRAQLFLSQKAFKLATEVNQHTLDRLRDVLTEGFAEGQNIADVAKGVRGLFDDFSKARSLTIARTEVTSAANGGIQEGYLQAGVEEKKWLASRDEDVRDDHKAADNQVVSVKDPFDIGGFMLAFPGDPNGNVPAEQVINCRCTTVPILKKTGGKE